MSMLATVLGRMGLSEQLIAGLFVFGYGAVFAASVWALFYLAIKELDHRFDDEDPEA